MKDYDFKLEKVMRVVDGDTQEVIVSGDIGFHLEFQAFVRVRLLDIDTPEKNKPEQHDMAVLAQNFATAWYAANFATIRVHSIKEDSFGRWLSIVYCNGDEAQSLSKALFDAGFQKPGSKWGPKV